ncbi:MAG TPA: FAD-dependent oxidoreductase [Casimicrobiaceae bacterium]|nr:FAD-dependent oxidoreductase [Casimicrobiaceae bacterium]
MKRDVVIIGGGVIGSAIASFALRDRAFDGTVTVIERDPTYACASSALSASSIRQQFSTAVNIEIGKFGIDFLRRVGDELAIGDDRPDIGLTEPGYLYLATAAGVPGMKGNHELQRSHGVDVALLSSKQLHDRFPWLATPDIALGSLGLSGEGWFDGYSLMQAFRRKARSDGGRYLHAEACGFDVIADRVVSVRLKNGEAIRGDAFVNAAGPWAANVARWVDIDLPVRARRRCVFTFSCPTPIDGCPLVIDPSGLWFRPEGQQRFICGISPSADQDADDLPLDVDHRLFDDVLWPALAHRVPVFDALRVESSWAGYYELNTFDHNGIVGAHPKWRNLYFANGFSGHGLQQAPAVGRGIAELIAYGRYRTLDLGALAFERIAAQQPIVEENVI